MNLLEKFKSGLTRTREKTLGKISAIFNRGKLNNETIEEIEEALLEADLGVEATENLIESLRNEFKDQKENPLSILKSNLINMLDGHKSERKERFSHKPWVILLVGVNGSGKTTTAGKLAYRFSLLGKKSVIAAADTFRAAAVEQVEIWAKRGNARIVKQVTGSDPAAVAYDAMQSAIAKGEDVLIVDTAGRLQAKRNLMEELAKITRVLKRLDAEAPHEILLVIDATTGQNGLSQARGFTAAAGGTGLVITKLDGTARGGIVVPIRKELNLPIEFIGLGEGVDDLFEFNPEVFVEAIVKN